MRAKSSKQRCPALCIICVFNVFAGQELQRNNIIIHTGMNKKKKVGWME